MSTPDDLDEQRLLVLDHLLLKAVGASTHLVFASMERRVFQVLANIWLPRAQRALDVLDDMDGDAPASKLDVKRISLAVANKFIGWEDGARRIISASTRQSYLEGKRQILLRAHGKLDPLSATQVTWPQLLAKAEVKLEPSFTQRDERAIRRMVDGQMHWIGEHYENNLALAIDETIRSTMLESGLGRAAAGRLLREYLAMKLGIGTPDLPKNWKGESGQYFELIAANAVTNGRVQGSLAEMTEIGVTRYVIVAVGDERTCGRCRFMDGRSFELKHAERILNQLAEAETPEDVKRVHPWARTEREMQANPERFPFPPFHGICRCTVDISEDAEISFD